VSELSLSYDSLDLSLGFSIAGFVTGQQNDNGVGDPLLDEGLELSQGTLASGAPVHHTGELVVHLLTVAFQGRKLEGLIVLGATVKTLKDSLQGGRSFLDIAEDLAPAEATLVVVSRELSDARQAEARQAPLDSGVIDTLLESVRNCDVDVSTVGGFGYATDVCAGTEEAEGFAGE
jgi:hypothetical protein